MITVDSVAWGEALGVGPREVTWILGARAREVEELMGAIDRLRSELREAPDEELLILIGSASAALANAGDRINDALNDLRRET